MTDVKAPSLAGRGKQQALATADDQSLNEVMQTKASQDANTNVLLRSHVRLSGQTIKRLNRGA
jgi:hypothetical protein